MGEYIKTTARPPSPGTTLAARLIDLVLPVECAGCGVAGAGWCGSCDELLHEGPVGVRPRVDPGVPVWSTGPFAGPRRSAVIAMKERGRRDLADPFAASLVRVIDALREAGELDPPELAPLALVPAPSRPSAARRRGGDPVARVVGRAAGALSVRDGAGSAQAVPLLRLRLGVRDSVGLGVDDRRRNLAGRVAVRGRGGRPLWRSLAASAVPLSASVGPLSTASARPAVVFVDDVMTTGTTARESVHALSTSGIRVHAAIVVAHA